MGWEVRGKGGGRKGGGEREEERGREEGGGREEHARKGTWDGAVHVNER